MKFIKCEDKFLKQTLSFIQNVLFVKKRRTVKALPLTEEKKLNNSRKCHHVPERGNTFLILRWIMNTRQNRGYCKQNSQPTCLKSVVKALKSAIILGTVAFTVRKLARLACVRNHYRHIKQKVLIEVLRALLIVLIEVLRALWLYSF